MMNKTDRDNWRKFLGIKDPQTALDAARIGGDIGKTAGRAGGSVGGGSFDGENPPEGEEEEGAEKGDGGADAGEKLKVGDKFDRLEDLYDCETGEKVTIDGFGEKGSEKYPTGFQDCKDSETDPDYNPNYYWYQQSTRAKAGISGSHEVVSESYHQTKKQALAATWQNAEIQSRFNGGVEGSFAAPEIPDCRQIGCIMLGTTLISGSCQGETNPSAIATCNLPPPKNKWPAIDKNHLTWNKEKGCFEPLCPELNTAVSNKFKECQKEHVLCDKDGNKVKVEIDGNGVKITQAKYNQTAEFRNGKVTAVKKLTESQTEAEFK